MSKDTFTLISPDQKNELDSALDVFKLTDGQKQSVYYMIEMYRESNFHSPDGQGIDEFEAFEGIPEDGVDQNPYPPYIFDEEEVIGDPPAKEPRKVEVLVMEG